MCPEESGANGRNGGPRLVADGGRPESGRETCGSCGNLIDAGTTYCPHCGTHKRDRGSGAGDSSGNTSDTGGGSGRSSRRTADVSRRSTDDGGSSKDDSSRNTSDYAGGKSGRRGHDERRDSGSRSSRNRDDDRDRGGSKRDSSRDRGSGGERGGSKRDRGGSKRDRADRNNRDRSTRDRAGGRDDPGSGGREAGTSPSPGGGGRRMPDDDEEFCATCGEIINASASTCPACGDERAVASASAESSTPSSGPGPQGSDSSPENTADGPSSESNEPSSASGSGTDGTAGSGSPSTSTSLNNPAVNGWRWKIGWQPKKIIIGLTILGGIVGAMLEYVGQFAFFGLVVGVLVWFWGRGEVNAKYMSLIQDFRDETRSKVERETGGMSLSSAHTFIGGHGSSPIFIEPSKKYKASHLLFGDTSVVINRQYHYKMPQRTTTQGGKQQEVFYDQIANVQSEDFANYAELQISLSSGQTERIKGRDTAGINGVKRDLQKKMRDARR